MFGINQSKNASSASTNVNTTDSNNDQSYGSHNLDQSSAHITESHYDSHGVVNAQGARDVTVTDGGATNSAIDAIKGVALSLADKLGLGGGSSSGAGGGEPHYDAAAASGGFPTWAKVGLGIVGVLAVGGIVFAIARRK